ncbi:hypothetical protein Tco_0628987 [Tanacetum coccineum]|uniref:Uncharacterized protein n=1 Tax=Tanacetum coccineum TaxID=301880 RepID=A0ABQ4WRV3_9ASTR
MRIEESLNVTFDESFPEPKSSPSIEDDRINDPVFQDLNWSSSLQVNVSDEGYPKSLKEARGYAIEQVIGKIMMLLDNQSGSPNSVLDSKMLENSRNDSHEELYLNDEEDDGDSIVVPQTPSEEIRTKIDNTRVPPPLIRGIGEDKISDKIGNPLSLNHIEHGYSIYCENTIEMISSIKDIIEENMDMFSSISEAIKLMLAIVTNMICVIENDIGNEASKDNLKK